MHFSLLINGEKADTITLGVPALWGTDTKHPSPISSSVSAGNITNDIDLVVYTAAIHPDNPEFKAAKEAGLPMLTRAELLGQIMTIYKNAINIAGKH